MFWGEGVGIGGKVLVRDQLGVIAQVAATAAPRLVTAAVPRDLRIDPCEKKSKRDELGAWDKGALMVVGAGIVSMMSVATFYSGNAAAKFAKICGFE